MPLWFPSRSLSSRHSLLLRQCNEHKNGSHGDSIIVAYIVSVMDSTYRSTSMNESVEIHTDGQTRWFVAVFFSHSAFICSIRLPQCTATSALKSRNGLVIVLKTVYCEVRNRFFFCLDESPGSVRARALPLQIYGRRSVTERGRSWSTVGCTCQFVPPMPSLHPESNS
jgi:hypothetical protein